MEINKIYCGSSLEVLKTFPDQSVHCIVTSPPYWGLRDYGEPEQIGLEETPEKFISNLVDVFRQAKRVLRDDGTLWVNMGDSYAHNGAAYGSEKSTLIGRKQGEEMGKAKRFVKKGSNLKPKDLVGIPWMLAFALRADGWYLRQDIIWSKPNPMPESVTDRCTKSHEYIFLLSKSTKYYYDAVAIKTPIKDSTAQRMIQQIDAQASNLRVPVKTNGAMKAVGPGRTPRAGIDNAGGNQGSSIGIPAVSAKGYGHRGTGDNKLTGHSGNLDAQGNLIGDGFANKKSVWTVPTKPFSEAHFATFPEELIIDCIKSSTSEMGVCNKCGSPLKRVFTKELRPTRAASYNTQPDARDVNADKQDQSSNRVKDGHKPGWYNHNTTYGWVPTCKCEDIQLTPAIVLDFFMGAGTTALAARKTK